MIYPISFWKLRKGANKKGKGKGNWWFKNIRFGVEGLIPKSDKDTFDTECKGNKRKVMRYITRKLKAHFAHQNFNKDDAIFEGIKDSNTYSEWGVSGKTSMFEHFHTKNQLRYSIRNAILAIEYLLQIEVKYTRAPAEVQVEKELRKFPTDCSEKTRAHFRERSEYYRTTEEFLNRWYYEENKFFKEDLQDCHYCRISNLTHQNGSYRTVEEATKLAAACVCCQHKLLKHHKCPDTFEREEWETYRIECEWCYHRSNKKARMFHLRNYCGATEDQMDLVELAFNRARELNKFQGKLTFARIVEDLKGMSFDNFNKKYNFHSWER